MPRVFISHSSFDTDLADAVCGDLRCAGCEPWIDTHSIRAGSPIVASIDEAILKCHYFVVILSSKAIASQWVGYETTAVLWERLSDRRRKHIIPAIRELCDIPAHLRHLRYADFTNGYAVGFAQIYSAIDLLPVESRWPTDILPADQLVSLERDAGEARDHIRFACAHTIWSIRPDRAKFTLENQLGDMRDYVNRHAKLLLDRYF
jgi:hypothetical protein